MTGTPSLLAVFSITLPDLIAISLCVLFLAAGIVRGTRRSLMVLIWRTVSLGLSIWLFPYMADTLGGRMGLPESGIPLSVFSILLLYFIFRSIFSLVFYFLREKMKYVYYPVWADVVFGLLYGFFQFSVIVFTAISVIMITPLSVLEKPREEIKNSALVSKTLDSRFVYLVTGRIKKQSGEEESVSRETIQEVVFVL